MGMNRRDSNGNVLPALRYLRFSRLETMSSPVEIHRREEEPSDIVDIVRFCSLLKTWKLEYWRSPQPVAIRLQDVYPYLSIVSLQHLKYRYYWEASPYSYRQSEPIMRMRRRAVIITLTRICPMSFL